MSSPLAPSDASSVTVAEKDPEDGQGPNEDSTIGPLTTERLPSPNIKTEANIFPEAETTAEADLENHGVAPKQDASASSGGHAPPGFPDGGSEAWMTVFGSFCCLFCSFGWINAIGVFQEYYSKNQLAAYSQSTIAWIPSFEIFFMFASSPVSGKLFDSFGPRWPLLAGSFLHVFGLMMASLSTEYYQFLLSQGICSAMGASAIFNMGMSSTSTWFFNKRAMAIGIAASGSSLGGVIYPIMVTKLIPQIGYAWTMRVVAFTILGMLIMANLTVKSRLKPTPKPFDIMEFINPMKEVCFLLLALGGFLFFFGTFLPFNYVILQAQQNGMTTELSNYLVPILNATSIFGRILPGYLADKVGRFNVTIITTAFSAIIVLALWLPSRAPAPIIVFVLLYGFSSGAFVSLIPSVVAQISDIRQIGIRNGTISAIISFAALTGNPIGGALVTRNNGGFNYLQIFCGVTMAAGSAAFVASRWVQVGFQIKKI